jgi:phenylacetate-coenzyme A ligase PaaK-like adenylate-forming protein
MTGHQRGDVRFSIPAASRGRVGITAGTGGNPAFFVCDANAIAQALHSCLRDFEMLSVSRYVTIWMDELLAWQAKHS